MIGYTVKIIAKFVNVNSPKNIIERYSRLFRKSFSDPDNLHKLDNLVEVIDYEKAVDEVCSLVEKRMLGLFLSGYTQSEIAKELKCSQPTVSRKFYLVCKRMKVYLNGH